MEILVLLGIGWAGSGLLAYGLEKNYWLRKEEECWPNLGYDEEWICIFGCLLGPAGLMCAWLLHRNQGWKLALRYRIPKQKALSAPDQKSLIKQTGREKVLAVVEIAKNEYAEEERIRKLIRSIEERMLSLANQVKAMRARLLGQQEAEQALQKEIIDKSQAFSDLSTKLSRALLKLRPRHMKNFGQDEYHSLDDLIKKEIGLGHRIHLVQLKFWRFFIDPANKLMKSEDEATAATGIVMALATIFGIPMTSGMLIHLLTGSWFAGILAGTASFMALCASGDHYDSKGKRSPAGICLEGCDQCNYLEVSKFLKGHNISKQLSVEKVK